MMGQILAEYPSKSSAGKVYEIREGNDGVTYCSCWQWKKNKNCSHLKDYHARGGIVPPPPPRENKSVDVQLQEAIDSAISSLNI